MNYKIQEVNILNQILLLFLLCGRPLGFKHDALEFFKNSKMFIGRVDFGICLFFRSQEADFLQTLKLSLYVAGIFFDQFSKSSDMGL